MAALAGQRLLHFVPLQHQRIAALHPRQDGSVDGMGMQHRADVRRQAVEQRMQPSLRRWRAAARHMIVGDIHPQKIGGAQATLVFAGLGDQH